MIRTRTEGFSLIELMIVGGLITVLAAMAGPLVAQGMERYRVISASQQVVSTIRAARNQAVARNVTLRVRFNHLAAGQYQALDTADAAVGQMQYLPDRTSFGAISGDIQIDTSGRVTHVGGAVAPATIVVGNGNAAQNRTITVSASGRVQLP